MNIERSTVYRVGSELCRCLWDILDHTMDNSICYSLQDTIWSQIDLSSEVSVSDEIKEYEYTK